jgi:pimeloyl-ACP methyl ester carboxylesterase
MATAISMTNPNVVTFQARWNQENKHLEKTLLDKITQFFFGLINPIIKANVLPASRVDEERKNDVKAAFHRQWFAPVQEGATTSLTTRFLRNQYTPTPIEVMTPDGAKLRGTHFKSVRAQANSPTIIFFQPNAALSKQGAFDWLLLSAAMQELPYNFVYFDYRGCGESEGSVSFKKDVYLDGDSIYQYVRDQLRVPEANIHFYGWSLGGGISANVKKLHSQATGNLVVDRSFSSVVDVVHNFVNRILALIAAVFLRLLNWNIENAQALHEVRGKVLVVHHPQDELMKDQASLAQALFQQKATPAPQHIHQLDLSASTERPYFIHGAPIGDFATDRFDPASDIAQFLFSTNCTFNQRMVQIFRNSSQAFQEKVHSAVARLFQEGGLYWGSGADACHSRNGLSLTEEQLVTAVCQVKLEE